MAQISLGFRIVRDVPIGIDATGLRRERDRTGVTDVSADRYWGAGTQRALKNLVARGASIPGRFHRSYGIVKRAAAVANGLAGRLPAWKVEAISKAADDLAAGLLADHFPLPVWQSGSGRDTDTNVNEVLANRAIQLLDGVIGSRKPIDPAEDVNMGQGVGTSFTTAMHIAIVLELEETLAPRATALLGGLDRAAMAAHARRLREALARLDEAEGGLHEVVSDLGAHGTGARWLREDWQSVAATVAAETGRPFILPPDAADADDSMDAIVFAMAAIRGLALVLADIARALRDGRARDRPGATTAPFDAMAMVGVHVAALDAGVATAVSHGRGAAGAMRPLVIASALDGVGMLGDSCETMRDALARGV